MYFATDKIHHVWYKQGDSANNVPDTLGRMDMEFLNSNSSVQILAEQQVQGYLNFYGHTPNGIENVPTYEKITYQNLYSNTDLKVTQEQGKVNYEITFNPGANANTFQLKFTGTSSLDILQNGGFRAKNHIGVTEFEKPIGKKKNGNQYTPVNVTLNKIGNDVISITIQNYQTNKEFVVSLGEKKLPPINLPKPVHGKVIKQYWATYYGGTVGGGGGTSQDEAAYAVDIDAVGNSYMTGSTGTTDFPVSPGAYQANYVLNFDAFVVKFGPQRNRVFATYYGANDQDHGIDIKSDAAGNSYFTGWTSSTNMTFVFGTGMGSFWKPFLSGNTDAFIVKLSPTGSLVWNTNYGGSSFDNGQSITIKGSTIYLVGSTYSNDLTLATSGSFNQSTFGGAFDAFIVKLDLNATFSWSTYYGGSGDDYGAGCTIDKDNNLFITGISTSNGNNSCNVTSGQLPLCSSIGGAYVTNNAGGKDIFIAKLDPSNTLKWATFYGGSQNEQNLFYNISCQYRNKYRKDKCRKTQPRYLFSTGEE